MLLFPRWLPNALPFKLMGVILFNKNGKLNPDTIHTIQDSIHSYFRLNWEEGGYNYPGNNSGIDPDQKISNTFLSQGGIGLQEIHNIPDQHDLITYLLLGLLFGIALIWYFFPERLASIFNFPSAINKKRQKDPGYNSPGFAISFLLFLNYLITFSLFTWISIKFIFSSFVNVYSEDLLLVYVPVLVITFYIFKILFIRITGFLFKTGSVSKQQQLMFTNIDNLTGVVLIPIIFLVLFSTTKYFILAGIIVILIFQLFKWLQTFILGKFIGGFSVLHLFMYLCTLEIIPVLILIKVIESNFV